MEHEVLMTQAGAVQLFKLGEWRKAVSQAVQERDLTKRLEELRRMRGFLLETKTKMAARGDVTQVARARVGLVLVEDQIGWAEDMRSNRLSP